MIKFLFVCLLAAGSGLAQESTEECRDMYKHSLESRPGNSLVHYRLAMCSYRLRDLQAAANEFREALSGDLRPAWVEVWSWIYLGKIFDKSGQRDRAVNQYQRAQKTRDNTLGALEEAARCEEADCKL